MCEAWAVIPYSWHSHKGGALQEQNVVTTPAWLFTSKIKKLKGKIGAANMFFWDLKRYLFNADIWVWPFIIH